MYAYLRAHTPFLQYTNFYIFATTHLQCSSNSRDSQEPLISISNVFVSILPAYISSVYYFRLIRKLCLACFGAYGNCMCCVSVSGAQNTKKKEKKLYIKHFTCIHLECSLLYFHFSGFFFLRLQWLLSEKGSEMSILNKTSGSWRKSALAQQTKQ